MMLEPDALASILADRAIVSMLMPWTPPCKFGPDDRYCLEELVGAGQSSLVYRATDLRMTSTGFEATVAIKIGRPGQTSEEEALTGRRVVHPNVVRVLDRGVEPGGSPYIITEFVPGGDLQSKPGPWPPRRAAEFMAKVARAVHAAHSAGVVHCDLKPANILLTNEGEPKLADFDLSRSVLLTETKARGNIAFMSPEQFNREPDGLTPPSDIYALGGLCYSLLTGKLPNGDTPEAIAASHQADAPPPTPNIDQDLDRICTRALARARDQRHESAAAFAADLERWLRHDALPWGRTPIARRVGLWTRRRPFQATALAVVLVLASAATTVGTVMARSAARERATRLEAQAESIRRTSEEVEKVRGRMRLHIQSLAGMLTGRSGDLQDGMLPTLTWLQWIADIPVLSSDGEAMLAPHRIDALRGMVQAGEREGRTQDIDVRLARFALLYFLVLDAQSPAAVEVLEHVRKDWTGSRDRDPMTVSINAIATCITAEVDVSRPRSERVAALKELDKELYDFRLAEPARRLVARVGRRLAADPAPLQ